MSLITLKSKLYPKSDDIPAIDKTMSQYQLACNFVSQYYFNGFFKASQSQLNHDLYHRIRDQFDLKSQMAQSVLRSVLARYKTVNTQLRQRPFKFQDSDGKWKTIFKDLNWLQNPIHFSRPQCDEVSKRDWSIINDKLSINTIADRVKMKYSLKGFEKYLNLGGRFGTAKLVKSNDHYYLYISYEYQTTEFDEQSITHVVGLDRGLRFLTTIYDETGNTEFFSGQHLLAKRRKFKRVRQQLQRKGTKSAHQRLKTISQRENRYMTDVNHQITKTLIDKYGKQTLFVVEDLTGVIFERNNLSKTARNQLVSWSFYQFEQDLKYKAEQNQSKVIEVNAQYTSQRCPKCGYINQKNRNHEQHLFSCLNCGYKSNDDRVGAMNIQQLGTEWNAKNSKPKIQL